MTANDPCLNFTANQEADDNANLICRRAVAAFNNRDEAARERCRFAVEPKCRSVRGAGLQRCSIKKMRPRTHFVCLIAKRSFEVEAMIYCAAPLFPGLPLQQQQPLQPIIF
ncbi:unnamed protein product [Bemisia tabaci]|uniref:Uncharacterized protein n=1 Tax=Bemisia tabaci TaxID=7038 RepID=A0A9P0F9X3_BEMTA|nr:unnamed protein product [Bemisia tabaci]